MLEALVIALVAGAVLGGASHRAGLCTVKAVAEMMTSARGHILWSFVKASLWTTIILGVAALLGSDPALGHRTLGFSGLMGALVFGLGAGLNGACAFSTMSRLAEGHLVMLMTVAGWVVALTLTLTALSGLDRASVPGAFPAWLVPVLAIWLLYELRAIWIAVRSGRWKMRDSHWPLSVAVLLIAIANAALVLSGHPWSFTSTAICALADDPIRICRSVSMLWAVTGSALVAMAASAMLRRTFRPRLPRPASALRHFVAGLMMGAGSAVMPGGNDSLILFGLPSLSPHALPSWVMIVLGIYLSLRVMQAFGKAIPVIRCDGDICRSGLDRA